MLAKWIERLDEIVWGPWMLVLLLGTGAWLMIKLDFLPIRRLGFALRCVVGLEPERSADGAGRSGDVDSAGRIGGRGGAGRRGDVDGAGRRGCRTGTRAKGSVSPFASLTTELAATIGTGNIVGVATAMVLGGPGALVWMVAASLLGMATKLVESTLSVKYRRRNERGEWVGGPMYTLRYALPAAGARRFGGGRVVIRAASAFGNFLALSYAFFAVLASFGMGNMTQANSIAESCRAAFGMPVEFTGLLLTVAVILTVLGGIRSIAKVSQVLVPFMGIFYILGTLAVILANYRNLPAGIATVLGMAFRPGAVSGGIMGNLTASAAMSVGRALRFGVSRGVFSNEAGIGAAGITAAAADTEDHIRQGYISMTGVFLDTCLICAFSGLAFAASGLLGATDASGELLNGADLTIAVFYGAFGPWGAKFVSVSIALFAFATIIAWAYQGEKVFEFLTGTAKYSVWYRFVYVLFVFVGAVCSLEVVWNFSDLCNGLMAVPNLIGVLALSAGRHGVCEEIKRYDKKIGPHDRNLSLAEKYFS